MKWKLSAFREPFKSHKVGEDASELRPDMGPQRGKATAKIGSARRASARKSAASKRGTSDGGSGIGSSKSGSSPGGGVYGLGRGRRVVVKARYRTHQAVRRGGRQRVLDEHLRYLARPNATGVERAAAFFDAQSEVADAAEVPTAWARDRHHWRIILSPEEGDQLDLRRYVRAYAQRLERELDTPLEWVAVTHHNTDQPHAHLLIRGRRGEGRDLTIPRKIVQDGLRDVAEELATRTLGERSEAEADAYLNRLSKARRPTPLDALLDALAGSPADASGGDAGGWRTVSVPRDWSPDAAGRHHLEQRLATLAEMQLAERTSRPFRRATWRLRDDFIAQLDTLVERSSAAEAVEQRREVTAEPSNDLQENALAARTNVPTTAEQKPQSNRELSNRSRVRDGQRDDDRGRS